MQILKDNQNILLDRPYGHLKFGWAQGISLLLMPLSIFLLLQFANQIFYVWSHVVYFFLVKTNVVAANSGMYSENVDFLHLFHWKILYPNISGSMPSSFAWWVSLYGTLILFILTFFISIKHLALSYFVRIVLLIHSSAIFYFYFLPGEFPYYLADYIKMGYTQTFVLLFFCPVALAFTYYIYDLPLYKKILVTIGLLFFIFLFVPLQYSLHAYIIGKFSLLYMPVLYFIFGILPNIFMVVVFFSLGLSWRMLPQRNKNNG